MKRVIVLSAFFSLLVALAQLQFSGKPLVVPGDRLGWEEDELRLVLQVKQETDVTLDLYSPGFDPRDYHSANELGDERYDRGQGRLRAYFKLFSEDGRMLVKKSYGIEPHRWDTLFAGRLAPGNYSIVARFEGEGKNAVAFRLNTPPEVAQIVLRPGAMQTYNVHGHDWQDPFTVTVPDYGKPLKVGLYDGDGPAELQMRHTAPGGAVTRLPTPGNREWIYLTLKEAGEHRFGFRRPEGAYQVTNTVGIKVFYGPVKVTIVDTAGNPVPGADYATQGIYDRTVCLRAPAEWRLVDTRFEYGKRVNRECVRFGVGGGEVRYVLEKKPATLKLSAPLELCGKPAGSNVPLRLRIGDRTVALDGSATLQLPEASYPVTVEPVPGADVEGPSQISLQAGKEAAVAYRVRPHFRLELTLDPTQAEPGQPVRLDARLVTSFPGELPAGALELEIADLEDLTLQQSALEDVADAGKGLRTVLHRRAVFVPERPGRYRIHVRAVPCGPDATAELVVAPPATTEHMPQPLPQLERSLDKHVVVPGETVAVELVVHNRGDADLTYDLRDRLPGCLRPKAQVEFTGVLAPGRSATHRYPAEAVFDEEQTGDFLAELTSNGGDLSAPDRIRCVLVPVEKTVAEDSVPQGQATAFVVRVQNPTDHGLNVTVKDVPQAGLGLAAAERSFDLEPGAWGEWRIPVAPETAGAFRNEAVPFVNDVQAGPGAAATLNVVAKAAPPQQERRSSQITLPFELDRELAQDCGALLVAHRPPAGSSYLPGSSRLDGRPVDEPRVAPDGRLIWKLPAANRGVLSYRVQHEGPLPRLEEPELTALYAGAEQPLVGRLGRADYEAAAPLAAAEPGLIVEPATGQVMGGRDRITVVVRSLDGRPPTLIVNGRKVPEAQIGERLDDPTTGERRFVFHDVPLRPGRNSLLAASGSDRDGIEVFVAGAPARFEVQPLRAVADGRTPVVVEIRVLDAAGLALSEGSVVVASSLEPLDADTAPTLSGYRVRLEDGRALLRLKPTSTPQTVRLALNYRGRTGRASLRIAPTDEPFWMAHGSIVARYDFHGNFELGGTARGYVETPLWGGHLQGALDGSASMPALDPTLLRGASGLHETEEPDRRFPLTGSAVEARLPLVSDDAVAFRYLRQPLTLGYRRLSPDLPGVQELPQMTALHLETAGPLEVRSFAALVPRTTVTETIVPDGTRAYWLSGPVRPGSERIVLQVGAGERELERLRDYVIDYPTGAIFLSHPLWSETDELLPVRLRVSYAPETAPRDQLAAGAGLRVHLGAFTLGAGAATLDRGANWRFGAELAYRASGLEAALTYGRTGAVDRFGLSASGRAGILETRANLNLAAGVLSGKARFTGHLSPRDRLVLEHRARTAENRSELTYERGLGAGFSLGAGLGYVWETASPELLGRARYAGTGLSAELTHAHPLGASRPESRLLARYAFDDNLDARADLDYTWGERIGGSLGLEQKVGRANLAVSYVLPGTSGEGNRARFGIRAPLPLSRNWSLDLSAGYEHQLATGHGEAAAGAGVRYASDRLNATLGIEGAGGSSGRKLTLRAGASGEPAPGHSLGFDANYRVLPEARGRFSVSYAFRGRNLTLLTYHRLSNLTEAVLEGELAPTWHPGAAFQLRPSFAYRWKLEDPAGSTYQAGLAGNVYLTRRFGIGAGVYYQWQPASSADHLAFTVEASLRVLDEVWLNLGYTFGGFNGLTPEARPGIYLRLDLLGGAQ